eukprot:m.224632 g.224632  ORF g.224632 m.224632 type:complete len:350 (-) comp33438_c4_seq1:106-1155(-)
MASKIVEVIKELTLITGVHAVVKRTMDTMETSELSIEQHRRRRALAAALAIAALTSTRWRENNRRLLATFLVVRSYDIYRGTWANSKAIMFTFWLTAGEFGRRWMDWSNPKLESLHHQFVSVMGNLSGAGDWKMLAEKPLELSKNWTLKDRFAVLVRATKFCVPLLVTAYGLQEVIKAITHVYQARKKRIAISRESPGHRGLEFADRPYVFKPVVFVSKVVRTSAMYMFLGSYTVLLQTKGIVKGSDKMPFLSVAALKSNILFFTFGVFGLEPFSRGRILAEYYVAHMLYALWSDAKRVAPSMSRNFDKLGLAGAMAFAVLSERHESLNNHLIWAENKLSQLLQRSQSL